MFYNLFKKRFERYLAEKAEKEALDNEWRESLSLLNKTLGNHASISVPYEITKQGNKPGVVRFEHMRQISAFREITTYKDVYVGDRSTQIKFFNMINNMLVSSYNSQSPETLNNFIRRFIDKGEKYSEGWQIDGKKYRVFVLPDDGSRDLSPDNLQDAKPNTKPLFADNETEKPKPKRRGKTRKGSRKGLK